jgi:hypothetical protein
MPLTIRIASVMITVHDLLFDALSNWMYSFYKWLTPLRSSASFRANENIRCIEMLTTPSQVHTSKYNLKS